MHNKDQHFTKETKQVTTGGRLIDQLEAAGIVGPLKEVKLGV
jgi:hypothetical protein